MAADTACTPVVITVAFHMERMSVVKVAVNGIRDWHVMDAGPLDAIHPFIHLLGLSNLSASQADSLSTWADRFRSDLI